MLARDWLRILSLFLVLLPAEALAQGDANPWFERRVLNMSHRGGRAEAPEHTLYAYHRALTKGVTTLEIDVQRTSDGVLVVHHDSTVDRVTDGTGRIDTMTLATLRTLDNAYWFSPVCEGNCKNQPPEAYPFRGVASGAIPPPPGFRAEDFQITTMREVLETFPDVLMSIEIKGSAPDSVPAAEELADMLREFGRITDVLIASFDDATIAAFKARDSEIHTTPGLQAVLDFVANPQPLPDHVALQIPRTFQGAPVVGLVMPPATANDLPVYVFIDPSEETAAVYNELIDQGVAGIITDRPTALQEVLAERGVVAQGQSRDQQKCINALNKNFAKLAKAQGRDIRSCIESFARGRSLAPAATLDECVVADRKGAVEKAERQSDSRAAKSCSGPAPHFGPQDPNTVTRAALQKDLDLVHDLFGFDLDLTIAPDVGPTRPTWRCQRAVLASLQKCQDAKLAEFNRCKKKGLQDQSLRSSLDLQACLGQDPRQKVARACDAETGRIRSTVERKCEAIDFTGAFPELTSVPGCGGSDPALLAQCLDRLVECEVCLALNQADELDLDCDEFDDAVVNGSCSPPPTTACGPLGLTCDLVDEICVQKTPISGGVVHSCEPVPPGCAEDRTCACAGPVVCATPFLTCSGTGPNSLQCECPGCQ